MLLKKSELKESGIYEVIYVCVSSYLSLKVGAIFRQQLINTCSSVEQRAANSSGDTVTENSWLLFA